MREVLFKAKSTYTGNWIKGYYIKAVEPYYSRITDAIIQEGEVNDPYEGIYFAQIDRETLCQYTGLTDKNDNKIFEGDKLKGDGHSLPLLVVAFEKGGFYTMTQEGERYADLGLTLFGNSVKWGIIGNIHDKERDNEK